MYNQHKTNPNWYPVIIWQSNFLIPSTDLEISPRACFVIMKLSWHFTRQRILEFMTLTELDFNNLMLKTPITEIYKTMLLFTSSEICQYVRMHQIFCHYSFLNSIILQRQSFKTLCKVAILAVKFSIVIIKRWGIKPQFYKWS